MVSPEFLEAADRILIVDDFLATGKTIEALAQIVQHAGATLVGIVAVVEKSFEGGREALAHWNVPIEAMAVISDMSGGEIVLAESDAASSPPIPSLVNGTRITQMTQMDTEKICEICVNLCPRFGKLEMDHDAIIIIDYGSQYTPLIARQVRKLNFYCEIFSWRAPAEEVMALNPKGFVLSGGPSSVYAQDSPSLPEYVLASGRPILGICYGMQLLAHHLAGQVVGSDRREYGPARLIVDAPDDALFQDWQLEGGHFNDDDALHSPAFGLQQVWMSHADTVDVLPPGFRPLAHTEDGAYAAAADATLGYYAIQFHPEVSHTPQGHKILRNFIGDICACEADWTPANFIAEQVAAIREQDRRRPGRAGSERGRGLGGDGRARSPGRWRAVDLHLRRPRSAAPGRGRPGDSRFRAGTGHGVDPHRRRGRASGGAGRRDRPGAEAQDYRGEVRAPL